MSENEIDDVLKQAFLRLHQSALPDAFKEAVASQPRAPLAVLIDTYLREHPQVGCRALLQRIANLNQGQPEDLDRPDFQSYLIGRFAVSESDLNKCRLALGTYRRLMKASAKETFLAAARDESGSGGGTVGIDEIRSLFKKRKR